MNFPFPLWFAPLFLWARIAIIPPLLAFAIAAAAEESPPAKPATPAPQTTTLTIKGATVYAEIAATTEERRAGFSHRPPPPPDGGILFLFPQPSQPCLWMRDVSFPLDAAFIGATGEIVGVATMTPRTTNLHCAPAAVLYALEVNAGWLQKNQIGIGDTVAGLPPPRKIPPAP